MMVESVVVFISIPNWYPKFEHNKPVLLCPPKKTLGPVGLPGRHQRIWQCLRNSGALPWLRRSWALGQKISLSKDGLYMFFYTTYIIITNVYTINISGNSGKSLGVVYCVPHFNLGRQGSRLKKKTLWHSKGKPHKRVGSCPGFLAICPDIWRFPKIGVPPNHPF